VLSAGEHAQDLPAGCEKHGPERYSRHVVPGYGHIDCMFGKNAVVDVYPIILEHLEKTALG